MDLAVATVADLTRALRDHTLSSRELLDGLLARIEQRNPSLGAVVALDVDRARKAADAADAATARGEAVGPLHGLPMTVKDVFETEGLVTTSGAPELRHHVPRTDALAVARLKAAGAIVFGKTNTPLYAGDFQTANEVYGVTRNPWDPSRTAGGSSGGSAVAVAAGLSPLELGSDIGGSIRIPAHCNGVYGLKPSWGVVPSRGHIPGPPGSLTETDVNCCGPLARSIADLRTALDVIAGPVPEEAVGWRLDLDAGPAISGAREVRVGTVFHEGHDFVPLAADVRAALEAFADRLAGAGARVEATSLPVALVDGHRTWRQLVLPIFGSAMPDEEFASYTQLDAVAGEDPGVAAGRNLVSRYRDWARANERRHHERAAWAALFEHHDVVLAPVMPTTAFAHDLDRHLLERVIDVDGVAVPHVTAFAWAGAIGSVLLPVVVLPVGRTAAGLPVGVQVVGPYLSDRRLLAIAAVLDEAAGPGFTPPPG
jgi:amidase